MNNLWTRARVIVTILTFVLLLLGNIAAIVVYNTSVLERLALIETSVRFIDLSLTEHMQADSHLTRGEQTLLDNIGEEKDELKKWRRSIEVRLNALEIRNKSN